jgi:hypothetical protein
MGIQLLGIGFRRADRAPVNGIHTLGVLGRARAMATRGVRRCAPPAPRAWFERSSNPNQSGEGGKKNPLWVWLQDRMQGAGCGVLYDPAGAPIEGGTGGVASHAGSWSYQPRNRTPPRGFLWIKIGCFLGDGDGKRVGK